MIERGRRWAVTMAAATLVLSAGGCARPTVEEHDYRQMHPLSAQPARAVLELAQAGAAVATGDAARLDRFARDYALRGRGSLAVSVGATGPGDAAARALAQQLAAALMQRGVRRDEIGLELVTAAEDLAPGTARLSYATHVVDVPECPDWSRHTSLAYENRPISNYGCATQRNFGLMLADPGDLLRARPSTGRDAQRAIGAVERWRGRAAVATPIEVDAATTQPQQQ